MSAKKKTTKQPSAKQLAARRKFAAAAKARSKAAKAKKATKRKPNRTIIKAKRVTVLSANPKKRMPRRPNITSAFDLEYIGDANSAERDGVKGWHLARKFFARQSGHKTTSPTKTTLLDLTTGAVWKKRAKNPKAKENLKLKRRNVQQGFYDGNGVFHPIRASADYAGRTAGETGGKPQHTRSKKRKAAAKKASATARQRAATKTRKATISRLAARSLQRSVSLKPQRKRRNVQQGFYDGNGVFHPIRASADYAGRTAGETGGKPQHTRSKKRKTAAKKASATARQRAATKSRKVTTSRLAARSLQLSVPLKPQRKRRNPEIKEGDKVRIVESMVSGVVGKVGQFVNWANKRFGVAVVYLPGRYESVTATKIQKVANNPNAADGKFAAFQGRAVDKHTPLAFPDGTPQGLYKLGRLHLIELADGRKLTVGQKTAWLCADTRGKLHLGTTADRLTDVGRGSLGEVKQVEYITSKPHLGEPDKTIFFHELGEESGKRPTLYADGKGGLVFKGGNYTITPEGIRD